VKQVPHGIIATAGSAYGIATIIKGQIGEAKSAMAALSRAVNDAFQLKGVVQEPAVVHQDGPGQSAGRQQATTDDRYRQPVRRNG
jgi:hypothetical protein